MALPDYIMRRVKKTFVKFKSTSGKNDRKTDFMVKMNLPPLMGRRDAAYDRAEKIILYNLAEASGPAYSELCAEIDELFANVHEDTCSIMASLSSPDTRLREERFFVFVTLLRKIVAALISVADVDALPEDDNMALSEIAGKVMERHLEICGGQLNRCRGLLHEQLCELLRSSRENIDRYRGYTSKSFSKAYSERYRSAHDEYAALFEQKVRKEPIHS